VTFLDEDGEDLSEGLALVPTVTDRRAASLNSSSGTSAWWI